MTKTIQQLREARGMTGYFTHAKKNANGKISTPTGAIMFRGVVYNGGGVHADALRKLLDHFPPEVLDKELTDKNFGFVVDGKYEPASDGESDMADVFHPEEGKKWVDTRKRFLKKR